MHYKSGLSQATPALSALSEANAAELYIFSAMTCIYTYATHSDTDDSIAGKESGLTQGIVLSRQSYSIISMTGDSLRCGPVGALFSTGYRRTQWRNGVLEDTFSGAQELRNLSAAITRQHHDPQVRKAYITAIDDILGIFNFVFSLAPEMREMSDILGWPISLTDEYLELLRQPTQEALVILAYFAVLPEKVENMWWLDGFGWHLFSKIYPLIQEEFLPWVQWPLRELGWSPDKQYSKPASKVRITPYAS